MTIKHLVLTDVDAIQTYVFSSVLLAPIVGASQAIRESDSALFKLAADNHCIDDESVCSGGVGLFVFGDLDKAKAFRESAAPEFKKITGGGSLSVAGPLEFTESSFCSIRNQALEELDNTKRLGYGKDETATSGWAWNCESCGAASAVNTESRPEGGSWRLCFGCWKRYDKRHAGKRRQLEYYQPITDDPSARKPSISFDLEKMTDGKDWALVILDGDGLGDRLAQFDSPTKFKQFSISLSDLIQSSLKHALRDIFEVKYPAASTGKTAPALVLFDGGDDIVIVTQAQFALPLVKSFSDRFQQGPESGEGNNDSHWDWAKGRIGFSAGVAIVRQGFPIQTAHRIAEGMLRNAKKSARNAKWQEGAVDYCVVTESYADPDSLLKERSIVSRRRTEKISFTGRPYRLGSNQKRSLEKLKAACLEVSNADDFPRNSLFDLRNNLTRSAVTKSSPGEAPDAITVGDDRSKIVVPYLKQWQSRIDRVPANKNTWSKVIEHLAGFDLKSEYPQADLADAINLWENPKENTQ